MKKNYFISAMMLITFIACTNDKFEDLSIKETKQQKVSRVLTPEEAIEIASDAISMLDDFNGTRATVDRKVDIDNVKYRVIETSRNNNNPDTLYYVVNYVDNAGFAIVSAERGEKAPLVAITKKGNYIPGEKTGNPGFDMYIDMMEAQMSSKYNNSSKNDGPLEIIRTDFIDYGWTTVGPLTTTEWSQGYPECYYCYNSSNELCVAGCVAIAVGQIMAYHESPNSVNVTFTAPNYDSNNTTVQLDWDLIKDDFSSVIIPTPIIPRPRSISDKNNMIAVLIREIGQQVEMEYGVNSSSAYSSNVIDCISYFGYSADSYGLRPYNWDAIVYSLNNNYPVYMDGYPEDVNEPGHAWVLDGYKYNRVDTFYYQKDENGIEQLIGTEISETKYLHMNWGWQGNDNGYFDYRYLEPDGDSYNRNKHIICGIHPNN